MSLEKIKAQAQQFAKAQEEREINRRVWQEETKPLLKTMLETIAKETNIGLHVQVLDWAKNSEAVSLTFGIKPSGIFEKRDNGGKHYMKHGGRINFAQAYNGEVFVIIAYPYVDELVTQKDLNTVGRFKPSELTESFIYEKVELFINEMTDWEKASRGPKLGFILSKEE